MHVSKLAPALAAAFMLASLAPAAAAETIATSDGDLVITPVHHGSVAFTWKGVSVFADPAPLGQNNPDPAAAFTALPAPQIIIVTHEHGDHFNAAVLAAVSANATIVVPQAVADKLPADLKGKAKVLANGESTEIAGVKIEAVPAYNITPDREKFHPKGRDNGYVLTFADKRVYIPGDTEDHPEMRALQNIDVAFLPMNLPYTMDVEHAADAVKAFKPKIVIPYHFGESDVNQFKTLVGDAAEVRLLTWYPS